MGEQGCGPLPDGGGLSPPGAASACGPGRHSCPLSPAGAELRRHGGVTARQAQGTNPISPLGVALGQHGLIPRGGTLR